MSLNYRNSSCLGVAPRAPGAVETQCLRALKEEHGKDTLIIFRRRSQRSYIFVRALFLHFRTAAGICVADSPAENRAFYADISPHPCGARCGAAFGSSSSLRTVGAFGVPELRYPVSLATPAGRRSPPGVRDSSPAAHPSDIPSRARPCRRLVVIFVHIVDS